MINLRPYQIDVKTRIFDAWNAQYRNVMLRMPTGSGKTKLFCSIVIDTISGSPKYPTAIMVHRKELVQQICLTLAEEGIQHNIIAPRKVIGGIIAAERRMTGKQFYNPNAIVTIVSVDTLNARIERYRPWAANIRQWIIDEAAHVLKENKWGRCCTYFPNARGLGVTAAPERLDRKGLGACADGVFDIMIEGPSTLWLIDNGFLCKYKPAMPESDYQEYLQDASNGADFSKKAMAEASKRSRITGDVVENYVKFANGKQAILFASDISTAYEMEKEFTAKGIVAKCLTGETPDQERLETLIKFTAKQIQLLINVDLFDEGLDVPGIECVIMARPTMSLGKYLQMVGRGLRVADGKEFLIVIDHVGNIRNHGLPCKNRNWTLERISKRAQKLNFMRICSNITCCAPYDRAMTECPWCGTSAIVATRSPGEGGGRTPPEQVDGDLYLIDPETLRELEAQAILEYPAARAQRVSLAAGGPAGLRAMDLQRERIVTQNELRESIALWAGEQKKWGNSDRMIHKTFYIHYGMTITEALGEPRTDMKNTIENLQMGGY